MSPYEALDGPRRVFPAANTVDVSLLARWCTSARCRYYILSLPSPALVRIREKKMEAVREKLCAPGPLRQSYLEALLMAVC